MSSQTAFMQFRIAEGFRNDTGPLTETYKLKAKNQKAIGKNEKSAK